MLIASLGLAILYLCGSVAWFAIAPFQSGFSWLPILNLAFSIIVAIIVVIIAIINLMGEAYKTYQGLNSQQKKKVWKTGKIAAIVIFNLLKLNKGRAGKFCRSLGI